MSESRFKIGDALTYGWNTFKAKPLFFVGLTLALALITGVPEIVSRAVFPRDSAALPFIGLLLMFVNLFLGMLAVRIALDFYDNGDTTIGDAISAIVPQYLKYLGGKVLYVLIIFVGFLLLIIPGVIVSLMFYFVGYLIVDRHLGPIEALKESKNITDGSKVTLLLFTLGVGVLNLLGFLCLFVGLLVTIPVSMLAWVYVYRQLSPKTA